jgi:hypothetical protein
LGEQDALEWGMFENKVSHETLSVAVVYLKIDGGDV